MKVLTRETVLNLRPCLSQARILKLIPEQGIPLDETALKKLLKLNKEHARWLINRLLTPARRIQWATAAAKRAEKHNKSCQGKNTTYFYTNKVGYLLHAITHDLELLKIWCGTDPVDSENIVYMSYETAYFATLSRLSEKEARQTREKEHQICMTHAFKLLTRK